MLLSVFDLDHTLIAGDSDVLWTEYLVETGILNERDQLRSEEFYRRYEAGNLDIFEFLDFQLSPLGRYPVATLLQWRDEFVREKIRPIVLPKAVKLVQRSREQGHYLLIMTATNRFITHPIADLFGVDELLATEAEFIDGAYTGKTCGIPCFREGKVRRFEAWLETGKASPARFWFYSDSGNDIPLLERATDPVAVDPDESLAAHARKKGWPVVSLR